MILLLLITSLSCSTNITSSPTTATEICGQVIIIDTVNQDNKVRSTESIRNDFETLMLLHENCDNKVIEQTKIPQSSYTYKWNREQDHNWSRKWITKHQ